MLLSVAMTIQQALHICNVVYSDNSGGIIT